MIKVSVMYPSGAGATFDMNYYLNSHMPMVGQKLGASLKGMEVDDGLGGMPPGSPAPFLAMAHLLFDSVEVFGAEFSTHGAAIQADFPKYTNTQPVIQISTVKLSIKSGA
jgi:uncharacterized protein (TIGR02118 family)